MNKCFYSSTAILLTLISATAPEGTNICESCVPITQCSLYSSMDRAAQQSWKQKYPCNNHHPDDYGTQPGSKTSGQEYLICCPNEIWGLEPKESSSSRLTDPNRFGNPQDTPNSFGSQNQNRNYPNVNNNQKNRDASGGNYDNRNTPTSGNIAPSRWSTTNKNRYWNDRPDKNQWNIGNNNFYQGNNRRSFNNNNRRIDNDRRDGGSNNNNYRRPNQPDDRNNDSRDQSSENNPYFPRPQGNSELGQCDRLTRFPPNPQSGCCGREASDDDRITDAPKYDNNFAPAFNRNWARQELPPAFDWSYLSFKENENITKRNIPAERSTNSTLVKEGVTSPVDIENRISGGKETELTQYPWTALLVTTFESSFQRTAFNCGGSLISSRFVLTAGHCVHDDEAVLRSVQVFLAEFDKRTFPRDCKITGEGRKCIDNIALYAENVIHHPNFDEKRLQNDIALIKLQEDVPYTNFIRPICLPSINIDDPEHARLLLTVSGWGRNGLYKSDIKQSTTVHLVPQRDCRKFYPDLTRRHLCAAGYTGEDTCKGDSGGPLMVLYRGKYFVVGVVSGKRTDAPCGSAVPSLYTNVYHYLDWIRRNIQGDSRSNFGTY